MAKIIDLDKHRKDKEVWGESIIKTNKEHRFVCKQINAMYEEWLRLVLNKPNKQGMFTDINDD